MFSLLRKALSPPNQPLPLRNFTLEVQGVALVILLKPSSRAKRISLRVKASTRAIVLSYPPQVSLKKLHEFAHAHGAWLLEQQGRLPQRVEFTAGAVFPFQGIPCRIRVQQGMRGVVRLSQNAHTAEQDSGFILDVPGDAAHTARKTVNFLKKAAQRELEEAAQRYAKIISVSLGRIRIKDTRSRWGSCSSCGDISFSYRLIFAPAFVLDYVAAHEVAHRREMNHSERFWSLLHSMTPHVDAAERWLKEHGATLHRYG